ncbi:HAD family hydrolase [Desulforhopalus sp. 52FAK]
MKISSIIFDLDGTLLDTIGGLTDTTNFVMKEFNFPQHSIETCKQFIGNGMRILIERAAPANTSSECIDDCCRAFKEYYSRTWKDKCCPYDGINAMLAGLQKWAIPLAVLSNKPHQFTQLFVEEFFPEDMFAMVYGQRDGFDKKPEPGVALEIAKNFGMNTDTMLFVGDSGVDIQTGKNAGMKTAGVSWGFRPRQELIENKPDLLLNHPLELLDHGIFTR